MDFRYRWKNGSRPNRDRAAQDDHLLDESQFETRQDQELAEDTARRYLNVPLRTPDEDGSVLPQAAPPPDSGQL